VLSATPQPLKPRRLQGLKALGYRRRGLVSDAEKALVLAGAQTFPGVPQQTCQLPCLRAAASPLANADRACKTARQKASRGPFYAAGRARQEQVAPEEPRAEVWRT
jgi:D-serine deaminase-like pyridoxal phosphate-dependent protein